MSMKVLLLIGSPKDNGSTSTALGEYLLECLAPGGIIAEQVNVRNLYRSEIGRRNVLDKIATADLIILSTPLYIDSPPAIIIRLLEDWAERYTEKPPTKKQHLLAISNCGFPESFHNDSAMIVYRTFADEIGLIWSGGLAMGGGGAINGRPLARSYMARHAREALKIAGTALLNRDPVPQEAIELMAKPAISPRLYVLAGHFNWYRQAYRNKTISQLKARPYSK